MPLNATCRFAYPPVTRRMLEFGCYLTSIGDTVYPPRTQYPVPGHPSAYHFKWNTGRTLHEYLLLFICSGSGTLESSRIPQCRVQGGNAFYLLPGEWHRYRPLSSTGWSEKWIGFNGTLFHQLRKSAILPNEPRLMELGEAGRFHGMIDELLEEVLHHPRTNKLSWGAKVLEILFGTVEQAAAVAAVSEEAVPLATGEDSVVERALEFVRDNCHQPLNVQIVARHCGVSRRTLERHFNAQGQCPIAAAINLARIERAEVLLQESQIPLKEIAYTCGFGSPHRMISNFHRFRGHPPGNLRGTL